MARIPLRQILLPTGSEELKTQVQQQAAAGEGKEHAGLGARVSSLHQRCERETDEIPRSAKGGEHD
jgi:hypothetical protein